MEKLTKSPRLNYYLGSIGIFNSYDVINHLPRRYDDFSYTVERNLIDKQRVVILGKILSLPKTVQVKGLNITSFDFMSVKNTYFHVVFFNQPYLSKTLNLEGLFSLVGTFSKKKNEINGTAIYKGEIAPNEALRPIYALPQGYQNHLFINLVKKSLESLKGKIYSSIPFNYINKYKLVPKELALNWAHNPENYEQIHQALRHLKYEEALLFSLRNQIIREDNKSLTKIKKEPIDIDICQPFIDSLSFKLTDDQYICCKEIIEDMNQSLTMYRLLQGDVGTGKTLVSFIALYANFYRGDQGALMAPTDALARQHYLNTLEIFKNQKIRIALLVGSTPLSEKQRIYEDLKEGYIDIVIGTHALFSKAVCYSSLGLVIIDEQHRFGVNQRIALANKGDHADLLMMSATPIPRSLALSIYGDLDISTLTKFPNKVRDVKTSIVDSNDPLIFEEVDKAILDNRKVYVVAPLIDFREDERYSVEKLYARFALKYHAKVGLLHGKMKIYEKENALNNFYNGETPILVSTQVIEVGIDVKSAGLMIIYDANNFGLASLHQLRGRIGRDGKPATCLLTYDKDDEENISRLNILVNSNDGFKIAEEDMKDRGPGELTGLKQSGIPNFAFLNVIDDYKIFTVARDDAKEILKDKNNKNYSYIIKRAEQQIEYHDIKKG